MYQISLLSVITCFHKQVFEENFHRYFEHSCIPLHFPLGLSASMVQSSSKSLLNSVEMKE